MTEPDELALIAKLTETLEKGGAAGLRGASIIYSGHGFTVDDIRALLALASRPALAGAPDGWEWVLTPIAERWPNYEEAADPSPPSEQLGATATDQGREEPK